MEGKVPACYSEVFFRKIQKWKHTTSPAPSGTKSTQPENSDNRRGYHKVGPQATRGRKGVTAACTRPDRSSQSGVCPIPMSPQDWLKPRVGQHGWSKGQSGMGHEHTRAALWLAPSTGRPGLRSQSRPSSPLWAGATLPRGASPGSLRPMLWRRIWPLSNPPRQHPCRTAPPCSPPHSPDLHPPLPPAQPPRQPEVI